MTNDELDYYLIKRDSQFTAPLLIGDYDVDPDCMEFLTMGWKKADDKLVRLIFAPPFPRKPVMIDYLYLEARQVYSSKVYEVLKDKEINNLQWVSAIIEDNDGVEHKNYWIANVYQEYSFFDFDKSERSPVNPTKWNLIKRIVLDKQKVLEVPLEDRLVFVSGENSAYVLYHKSVVDLILSTNPQGPVFVPVEDWRG